MDDISTVLSLVKLDLGITHTKRDELLTYAVNTAIAELKAKGVPLDLQRPADAMLASDYTCWQYRKRTEGTLLSPSLQLRIRERILKARADA